VRFPRLCTLSTGQRIFADPFDSVGAEIRTNGCYEPETVAVIRGLLAPGMVYVDVGAYIGHHTIIGSAAVGPGGQVHAFEASPSTYAELLANVRLNQCTNTVCNNVALSDRAGTAPFYLADVSEAAANSLGRTVHTSERHIDVAVRTLDDYFESKSIHRVDLVKVDVEGAELLFVRGAARTLQRFKPALILEFSKHSSAFSYDSDDLATELGAMGYHLFQVGPMPLQPAAEAARHDELYYNILAVPSALVEDLQRKQIISLGQALGRLMPCSKA
jgi:FkbM family methyltransferase